VQIEYLSSGVSDDLAYTIAIERSDSLIVDQRERAPMALRVTHLFRKENGEWKLLHRHADPLIGKTAPEAVLQEQDVPAVSRRKTSTELTDLTEG
jgi:ketosteroid isomerase-like protein